MKPKLKRFQTILILLLGLGVLSWSQLLAQVIPTFDPNYDYVLASHLRREGFGVSANYPESGKTNIILFRMSWFLDHYEYEFETFTDGRMLGMGLTDRGSKGAGGNVSQTNLLELTQIINSLPPAPTNQPPKVDWLLISGVRSNQWFTSIYDRRNVPTEVKKLFKFTGPVPE